MVGRGRCAYGDESFHEHATDGFYVLAAVAFDHGVEDRAREVFRALLGRKRTDKLHWYEMDAARQRTVVKELADLSGLHLVVVGSPVPPRRQERARAACLTHLMTELHGTDVERLCLEARQDVLNQRDVRTISGGRRRLFPKGTVFHVEHRPGSTEPLLWAADALAGAYRAGQEGSFEFMNLLANKVYDTQLETGC